MTSEDFDRYGFEWDSEQFWVSDTHIIYAGMGIDHTQHSSMIILYSYVKKNIIDGVATPDYDVIFRGESHEMINYLKGLKRNDTLNDILD